MDGQEDPVPCEDFATCGAAQFQNRQYPKNAKQQDSYFVVEDMGATFGVHLGKMQRVALYGVADGHGEFGELSANFVRRNLPPQLAQSPHFDAGYLSHALLDAFTQTELLQQAAGLPLWASGACVSVAAVSPTHIVVANCGDCRCVVADQGTAQDLSNDHNVEHASPEEIQRVLHNGGTIMPDKRVTLPGAPGRLATTRSLGDYWGKPQGPPEQHIISGLPELRTVARHPGQQYLILASDGIFGFMSSQDVVTLCLSAAGCVPPSSPLSRLAHTVLCTAVNARRSDDNCTCLIVDLSRVEATFAPGPPACLGPAVDRRGALVDHGRSGPPRGPGTRPPPSTPWRAGALAEPSGGFEPQELRSGPEGRELRGRPDGELRGGLDGGRQDSPGVDSDSGSSLVAPDEVCWCPWCWRQNHNGDAENIVLGSFEKWRIHMHEQHFDKLGGAYNSEEVVPCYWCCRPCATRKGQNKVANRLPFWGSHERVCRENPNKPTLPSQVRGGGSSQSSGDGRPGPRSPGLEPERARGLGRDGGGHALASCSRPRGLLSEGSGGRRRDEVATAEGRPPGRRAL
mmetsp:Transcript_101702/g.316317  ORF Transcript_101702/g.316317 Transcript_101702/m.316317 type:complete len:571 (-) Transcript_101702:148-1860(-)